MEAFAPLALAFVALFVAVDVAAAVPAFITLTEGQSAAERARTLRASVLTALVAGLSFMAVGRAIFRVLGVTVADFQVAGGAVLFAISLNDILRSKEDRRLANAAPAAGVGVVPLGVPLIVGPAVLTTLLSAADTFGAAATLVGFLANLVVAWAVLGRSEWITRVIGAAGTKGVAKVMSLLMAAIGVMLVRRGLETLIAGGLGR